jgi:hypothetical protein
MPNCRPHFGILAVKSILQIAILSIRNVAALVHKVVYLIAHKRSPPIPGNRIKKVHHSGAKGGAFQKTDQAVHRTSSIELAF